MVSGGDIPVGGLTGFRVDAFHIQSACLHAAEVQLVVHLDLVQQLGGTKIPRGRARR
jgi:hypothetical protein